MSWEREAYYVSICMQIWGFNEVPDFLDVKSFHRKLETIYSIHVSKWLTTSSQMSYFHFYCKFHTNSMQMYVNSSSIKIHICICYNFFCEWFIYLFNFMSWLLANSSVWTNLSYLATYICQILCNFVQYTQVFYLKCKSQ